MKINKRIIVITICAILAIFGVSSMFKGHGVKYTTKPVTQETITQYVEASGTIKPINTIEVGTQVSGTVAKIYVDYNSVVKKGDLLAELDPSLFQANVDQSTAKLNNARATYAKAVSTLNYKKNNINICIKRTMFQKTKSSLHFQIINKHKQRFLRQAPRFQQLRQL